MDNGVTNATEYDALGRPTKAISALGVTGLESWTQTEYDDINRRVIVRSDLETKGDRKKVAVQFFDQLRRVRLAKTLEDAATQSATNETDGIKVQTRYKTVAGYTYQLSSNPYRAATAVTETDPTMGWTLTTAWNTGRRSEVQTFSGAGLPVAFGGTNENSTGIVRTDIDANRTLVTDQAGKRRISKTNALGQLEEVWEVLAASEAGSESVAFPNTTVAHGFRTAYGYDTLNNLTTVSQGVQTRTFSYSSLSRLLSAANPESGTISYQYDDGGNLTRKTDARGVRTDYVYDALNRVKERNYSTPNGTPGSGVLSNYQETPNVEYFYGTGAPAVGKLVKVQSSVSTTEYTSFDILGRVKGHKQTTDGVGYETEYAYNLSGAMVEQRYPSGRVVKNVLDASGDLSMVQSARCMDAAAGTDADCTAQAGLWNYAKNFTYNPAGAVTSMQLGNGRWESTAFNSRLQPTQIALGATPNATNLLKLDYSYGDWNGTTLDSTKNNGNVAGQVITVKRPGQSDLVFDQKYGYDTLNRITSAEEKTGTTVNWNQTYRFDRYGNRNFNESLTTTLPKGCVDGSTMVVCEADKKMLNPDLNASDNRITAGQGWAYDAAGNVIADPQGRTFFYDAENKQVKVENALEQSIGSYWFDGDGKRIKKEGLAPNGQPELTVFVYNAGGTLIGEYSTAIESAAPKVQYLTADHLGSPRINTDQNGTVTSRTDYLPYGEEITALGGRSPNENYSPDDLRKGFTGYEKDDETGLDFAQARIYQSFIGRFGSVDPVFLTAHRILNPQGLNLYIYVNNTPLKFIDPEGEELRFQSEKEAKERIEIIRAGLPKEQRKAVDFKKDENGNILLTVDAEAAKKAGEESLLGRLNNVVSSKHVATIEFIRSDESFAVIKFGVKSETSLEEIGEQNSDEVTESRFTGLTLLENTDDRKTGVYFAQVGLNSDIPNQSRLLVASNQSSDGMTQAFFHETLVHFDSAIRGDANGRKTGKNAQHPAVDGLAGRIKWAVRENLKKK